MLELEVVGGGRRAVVPESSTDFVIGRSDSAQLVVTDPTCSREQAFVRWVRGAPMLGPISSTRPTMLNGVALTAPAALKHGDVIWLGATTIRVSRSAAAAKTPAALDDKTVALSPDAPVEDKTIAVSPTASGPVVRAPAAAPHTQLNASPGAAPAPQAVAVGGTVILGRSAADANAVLEHPTVSKRHASFTVSGTACNIRDLGSTNGTFVNGERISGTRTLAQGDRVRIGPFTFVLKGQLLTPAEAQTESELCSHALSVDIAQKGPPRKLLNNVSIAIRPGEFCTIMGPSGCGKSTLMKILGGRTRPTHGSVTWNGIVVHDHFDAIKHDIAFISQREVLPDLLTLRECLQYTARLRLPSDVRDAERVACVNAAIERVGLREQADTQIARLSGGQRKRASLANELLVQPRLMFLDEVTSGLDESTDREMMQLFRSLADNGIAIVCVTHTLANVAEWCDSLLVMAKGGTVAYHGPVSQVQEHFGVTALNRIYQELDASAPAVWAQRHSAKSPYYERVRGETNGQRAKPSPARGNAKAPTSEVPRPPLSRQLAILTARYLRIMFEDRATLKSMAAQAVVIAAALRVALGGGTLIPQREYQLLFLLGVSSFWFGCNNAAKEIVKERALFELERDVNLRIVSYVLSKFGVLAFFGSLEVGLLFGGVRLSGITLPHPWPILGVLVVAVLAGTGCGLAISGAVESTDAAVGLVPVALIPQILLSNTVITPLPDIGKWIGQVFITTYSSYQAELDAIGVPVDNRDWAWRALAGHILGFTIIAMIGLWSREWRRHRQRT